MTVGPVGPMPEPDPDWVERMEAKLRDLEQARQERLAGKAER